jgi:predicted transcriptional regulator of viral defense system
MAQPTPRRGDRRTSLPRQPEPPSHGARPIVFLDRLQAAGRYSFTRVEAQTELGLSPGALKVLLWRLGRQGRVVAPRRGYYVIVPPEYRRAGSLPPAWFIDELMAYLGRPYYVGVLSAAAFHGAAHQAPHEFQVVTDRPLRAIRVGQVRIRFIKKASVKRAVVEPQKTPTGTMRVATPEVTALDLVRYPRHAGSLANVVTVLAELAERLDSRRLVAAAKAEPDLAPTQRLGAILDHLGRRSLTGPLAAWLARRAPRLTRLRPDRPSGRTGTDPRWRVRLNDRLDGDRSTA